MHGQDSPGGSVEAKEIGRLTTPSRATTLRTDATIDGRIRSGPGLPRRIVVGRRRSTNGEQPPRPRPRRRRDVENPRERRFVNGLPAKHASRASSVRTRLPLRRATCNLLRRSSSTLDRRRPSTWRETSADCARSLSDRRGPPPSPVFGHDDAMGGAGGQCRWERPRGTSQIPIRWLHYGRPGSGGTNECTATCAGNSAPNVVCGDACACTPC